MEKKKREKVGRKNNQPKIKSKTLEDTDDHTSPESGKYQFDSHSGNNKLKQISAVKRETPYKVEDLNCSKCLEPFSEQILYLKHMSKCSAVKSKM